MPASTLTPLAGCAAWQQHGLCALLRPPSRPQRAGVVASGLRSTTSRLLGRGSEPPQPSPPPQQQHAAAGAAQQQPPAARWQGLLHQLRWGAVPPANQGSGSKQQQQQQQQQQPGEQDAGEDEGPDASSYLLLLAVSLLWGSYAPSLRYLFSMDALLTPQVRCV
jgi:hypothetical protein